MSQRQEWVSTYKFNFFLLRKYCVLLNDGYKTNVTRGITTTLENSPLLLKSL